MTRVKGLLLLTRKGWMERIKNLGIFMKHDNVIVPSRRSARSGGPLPVVLFLCAAVSLVGCRSPMQHREKADKVAAEIVRQKQQEALGQTEPFSIERPSDILRRRLLDEQDLPRADEASLGTDRLTPIAHWPKDDDRPAISSPDAPRPCGGR